MTDYVESTLEDLENAIEVMEEEQKIKGTGVEGFGDIATCIVKLELLKYRIRDEGAESYMESWDRLHAEIEDLVEENRKQVRNLILSTLGSWVKGYGKNREYFFDLTPIPNEMELILYSRDGIEILLGFYEDRYDREYVSNLEEKLESIDSELRLEAERFVDKSDGNEETVMALEKDYLPEDFWWRHPENWDEIGEEK